VLAADLPHRPVTAQPSQHDLDLLLGRPTPPEDLPAAALLLWDEIVPILVEANVLNRINRAALTALCVQWHRSVRARGVLAQEGLFALGSTGQVVPHPALGIERGAGSWAELNVARTPSTQ